MSQLLSTVEKGPIITIIIHIWIYPPLITKNMNSGLKQLLENIGALSTKKYKELTQNFSRKGYLWRESDEMDLLTQFLQAGNFKILGQDGLFSQNHVSVCITLVLSLLIFKWSFFFSLRNYPNYLKIHILY